MKNGPLIRLGVFSVLTTSIILSYCNQVITEATGSTPVTHIGTYKGSTTFTTSSANGVNPALFIEIMDKNGNLVQYEATDGTVTVPNTKKGSYVTQAKLLGKTMYRDLDTSELLESWEEGRNLELEFSETPTLTISSEDGKETSSVLADCELKATPSKNDTLDLINGEYVVNTTEFTLDGTESWSLESTDENKTIFRLSLPSQHTFPFVGGSWTGVRVYNNDKFEKVHDNSSLTASMRVAFGGVSPSRGVRVSFTGNTSLIDFKEWLNQNNANFVANTNNSEINTIPLTTDGYFSPETTAQVSIEGETIPLIASITVPTETLSFVIDPNQEADKQFIAPEFSVTNDTYAPLRLEIKSFTQITNEMNDVLPSKYSDWNTLNKAQSNDIALGIVPKVGDGWKSLIEGVRYVADDSNYELGVIKPAETVDFSFSALYGRTILKPLNLRYELSFIFDFE